MRALLLALAALSLASPAVAAPPKWTGASAQCREQRPPARSRRADGSMCGTVIWASPKAKADVAARGGKLIGAQLFRDFRDTGDGVWEGEVYVPELRPHLCRHDHAGGAEHAGRRRLPVSGRSGASQQVWTRVKGKKR